MRTPFLITTTAVASIMLAGCGSKQQTASYRGNPANTASASPAKAPKFTRTERATGDVRDALIHLQRIHFAYDSNTLLPATRTALAQAADRLKALPDVHIYIDGHTDERGTTEYNLALGDGRARAVRDYLIKLGIAPERLNVVTFGEEQPWDGGQGELAYAKNRRAEFRLMRGSVRLVLDDGVLYDDKGKDIAAAAF